MLSPALEVGGRGQTHSHVLPAGAYDAEVFRVQMQIMGGVVVLPEAAALPLTQDVAAEFGGGCHVGNVRVKGRHQVLRQ